MKRKRQLSKWLNKVTSISFYLCMLLVFYLILQIFVVTSFKIPSDSMEPSLLSGDYVLVEKCTKGARLFNVSSATNHEKVNIYRMPGWRDIHRGDILVFNFPYPGRWDSIVFDVMKYYVKRCIALPGDTLEIKRAHYKVWDCNQSLGNESAQRDLYRVIELGKVEELGIVMRSYPNNEQIAWTIAEFGPFYVPKRGSVIEMTVQNKLLYANVIEWEQERKLSLQGDSVLLGDSIVRSYKFLENYYFVSGDKMMNSQDSRYWGLLPEPFIVGRAVWIWKSVDRKTDRVRWNRIWKKIE